MTPLGNVEQQRSQQEKRAAFPHLNSPLRLQTSQRKREVKPLWYRTKHQLQMWGELPVHTFTMMLLGIRSCKWCIYSRFCAALCRFSSLLQLRQSHHTSSRVAAIFPTVIHHHVIQTPVWSQECCANVSLCACMRACLRFYSGKPGFSSSPFLQDMKRSRVDREETERVRRGVEQQQQAEDREGDSAFE